MKFVIRDKQSSTFYRGMTKIGPLFGGKTYEAKEFDSLKEAKLEMTKHSFAFAMAEVEMVEDFI